MPDRDYANFLERRYGEVRRIPLPRTPVNKGCLLDRWGAFSIAVLEKDEPLLRRRHQATGFSKKT